MYEGVWTEGIHYRKAPDGNPLISIEAYNRWVEGERITQALNRVMAGMVEDQSGLPSTISSSGGGKRSKSSQRKQTSKEPQN